MFVVDKKKNELSSLPAKEISGRQLKSLGSELAQRIVSEIAKKAAYPRELAKKLKINEQKVYYHIRNLEKARIIEVIKTNTVQGAVAHSYSLVEPAFVIKFKEFERTPKIAGMEEQSDVHLEPFIENGQLNAIIVVGSPDPHGPEKARSRDGYYGIDFALFLGTFLNYIPNLNVKLDTEIREEDLNNNLILIGGPVVNTVSEKINNKLPIYFDKENNWRIVSTISKKEYHSDETGIIVKIKNPFNPKKSILLIAGKRYAGTRAVMIAFLRHFKEIFSGNKYDKNILAKVVEGVDLDSDGVVDEVEILE
jgi:DNA-binding Lrp family transcriptional regulator